MSEYNFDQSYPGQVICLPDGQIQHTYTRDLRDSIIVHSGRFFWPLSAHVDDVRVEDIAWGLAHENRFSGQTDCPYTVAQHSVMLSHIVPPDLSRWALFHDATEAYMKDIPRPIKQWMPQYKDHESRLMRVIAEAVGLDPLDEPDELKPWDTRIAHAEMLWLMPKIGRLKLQLTESVLTVHEEALSAIFTMFEPKNSVESYEEFMSRYAELFPK